MLIQVLSARFSVLGFTKGKSSLADLTASRDEISSCLDNEYVLDKVYLISLGLLTDLLSHLIWKLRIYGPPDVMKLPGLLISKATNQYLGW